ncbi:MAG: hypothetical protein ABR600_12305 [Actinomycetota bacterium]
MGVVVFVLIAAAVAFGLWLGWYLKKKRREELARLAASLGLQYSASDPFNLLGLPFQLFGKGDGRGTENVLWGTWQDVELREFDYWYYDETTDSKGRTSRTYHRFSCAVAELSLNADPLTLSPESIFTRMADHLGFHDVPFESEDFNRDFRVKCRNPKFATDLIDARMMQWLMQSKRWSFELAGPYLLCFHSRVRPNELMPVIGMLKEFRDHVPRVAYDLYPASQAGGNRTG